MMTRKNLCKDFDMVLKEKFFKENILIKNKDLLHLKFSYVFTLNIILCRYLTSNLLLFKFKNKTIMYNFCHIEFHKKFSGKQFL